MLLRMRRKLFWFLADNRVTPLERSSADGHDKDGGSGSGPPAGGPRGWKSEEGPPPVERQSGPLTCGCGAVWSSRSFARGGKRKVTLVLMGLDNSGKTSLLAKLRGEPPCPTVPTWGFISKEVPHRRFKVCVYDLGGAPNIRRIWTRYLAEVHAAIFVVDSADPARFSEAREALSTALRDPHLARKPLLILANKQDLADSIPPLEVSAALDLSALVADDVRTFGAAAIVQADRPGSDAGLQEGINWLLASINKRYASLHARVDIEATRQMEAEKKAVAERRARASASRMEREQQDMESETQPSAIKKIDMPSPGPSEEVQDIAKVNVPGRILETAEEKESCGPIAETIVTPMRTTRTCPAEQSGSASTSYSTLPCQEKDAVATRCGPLNEGGTSYPVESGVLPRTSAKASDPCFPPAFPNRSRAASPSPPECERNVREEVRRERNLNCLDSMPPHCGVKMVASGGRVSDPSRAPLELHQSPRSAPPLHQLEDVKLEKDDSRLSPQSMSSGIGPVDKRDVSKIQPLHGVAISCSL